MSHIWAFVAWLFSLLLPNDAAEAARCAACVTMAYAAQAKADAPRPAGCTEGCGCGGTGWISSPEGFRLPCPCPASCKCKRGAE